MVFDINVSVALTGTTAPTVLTPLVVATRATVLCQSMNRSAALKADSLAILAFIVTDHSVKRGIRHYASLGIDTNVQSATTQIFVLTARLLLCSSIIQPTLLSSLRAQSRTLLSPLWMSKGMA